MEQLKLVPPSLAFREQFTTLASELLEHDYEKYAFDYEEAKENFSAYIIRLYNNSKGKLLPPGTEEKHTFWLISSMKEILGVLSIESDNLMQTATVTYDMSPKYKNQGFEHIILKEGFKKLSEIRSKK